MRELKYSFSKFQLSLGLFIGGFLLLALLTMSDYGLSWDEPTRWHSGDVKLDYYEQLFGSGDFLATLQTAPNDVYPGLYDIPLGLARRYSSVDAILLSRIWNAFFGCLSVVLTILIARKFLPARSTEESSRGLESSLDFLMPFLAGFCLLCIPEYYGHIFINPKDIPFAATYALATFALINLIHALPSPRKRDFAMFGVATGLVMATRPPGIVFLAYYGLVMTVWSLFFAVAETPKDRFTLLFSFVWKGVIVAAIAWFVLLPWWPIMHRNPFTASATAVSRLHTFSAEIPVLFRGQIYDASDVPFYYVVWMFFIKMPIWQLALLVAGTFIGFSGIKRNPETIRSNPQQSLAMFLLAFSVLFPVGYVLVKQPAIHNGFRHMFYVLPAVSVLAAMSWRRIMEMALPVKRWRNAAGVVTAICVLGTGALYWIMHPYQYVFYNSLVGGTAGSLNRYESDYWFTAGKEAVASLASELEIAGLSDTQSVKLFVSGPWHVIEPYLPENFEIVGSAVEADFFIGNTQMRTDLLVEGEEVIRIQRMGLPLVVVKLIDKADG